MDKRKRLAIQAVTTLIQNANFKGFFTGKIYQGAGKNVCVPGLNCYSCPGALGACPLGSLQNSLSSFRFKFPYYVLGLILFFGALLGRFICGFLCPFGFLQDLLYLIPFPKKIRTFKGDKILRYIKYAILIIMVIILPICFKLTPVFCKYLCPSGTLAGIFLAISDHKLYSAVGGLFTWKVSVLAVILIVSILIARPFCKYLCPLGAIYGLLNKVSLLRIKVDKEKCTGCMLCNNVCDMGVDVTAAPNSAECIRCGKCMKECPSKAIHY